jgi:AP endonuclease-1
MPKRKAIQAPIVDDSDLSPPPNDLDESAAALASVNVDLDSTTQPSKKRKTASSTVKSETVAESTNGAVVTTQKRTTRTRKVKPELEEEEVTFSSEEAPKPTPKKRQAKTKVVKREESDEEQEPAKPIPKGRARKKPEVKEEEEPKTENNAGADEKPAKKKRKTKEEKEAEAMPLSARTIGHKLFIGAHVSSAGGQSFHIQLYSTDIQLRFRDVHIQLTPLM